MDMFRSLGHMGDAGQEKRIGAYPLVRVCRLASGSTLCNWRRGRRSVNVLIVPFAC